MLFFQALDGAAEGLVPLDAYAARPVGDALRVTGVFQEPGQPHVVVGAQADSPVGSRPKVGLPLQEIERADAHRLLRARVGGPPRPLRHPEDEREGRHEALQGHPAREKFGREREVVEALDLCVPHRELEAIGRKTDVRVGEEQPLAPGLRGPAVESVVFAQPTFGQLFDLERPEPVRPPRREIGDDPTRVIGGAVVYGHDLQAAGIVLVED